MSDGIVSAIIRDEKTILTLSVAVNGEYGLSDMCIGLPCLVGKDGVEKILEIPLNGDELKKLSMFFIPIYNSVLCMDAIFSFEVNLVKVLIAIGMNIVYSCILTFVLTRIFNSENAMFSK